MNHIVLFTLILIPVITFITSGYSQIPGIKNGAYVLNDFDFNTTLDHNDFFAIKGVWNNDFATITHSYGVLNGRNSFLQLNYDVSNDGAMCGWFETLKYSYLAPDEVGYFDISEYDQFHLSYMGDGAFTSTFKVEFVEYETWKKEQFVVNNVTGFLQNTVIDLTRVKMNLDATRIRNFAILIEHDSVTENIGTLYFDDFYFVDTDEMYDSNEEFFDLISSKSFLYFTENSHPVTGLVRDRSGNRDVTSIAANGFGLASLCIGAERNWLPRSEAAERTKKMLTHLLQAEQSQDQVLAAGYKGFFYHILTIDVPVRRVGKSELSSIDSGLFFAGVVLAREYFDNVLNATEKVIRELTDSLLNRVDWNWMLDSTLNQFRMAWFPENDSFDNHWNHYTDETILINLLAIASGKVDVSTFYAWQRPRGAYGTTGESIVQSYWGSLFTYFFAHCWVDFKECGPDLRGVHWWENSRRAIEMNRQFCMDASSLYATYSDSSWGLSACLGPSGYNGGSPKSYGALPMTDSPPNHDGTVPPYGPGSAIVFFHTDPNLNESVKALKNFYNNYPRLWNIYGFADAYNLGVGNNLSDHWYANDYIAIDVGAILMMIENYRSGLIWNYFMNNENIRLALDQIFNEKTVGIVVNEDISKYGYNVYPNPTDQNLWVEFSLETSASISLRILGVNGGRISNLDCGVFDPGKHTLRLDLDRYNLRPGIYFIEFISDGVKIISKFMFIK